MIHQNKSCRTHRVLSSYKSKGNNDKPVLKVVSTQMMQPPKYSGPQAAGADMRVAVPPRACPPDWDMAAAEFYLQCAGWPITQVHLLCIQYC